MYSSVHSSNIIRRSTIAKYATQVLTHFEKNSTNIGFGSKLYLSDSPSQLNGIKNLFSSHRAELFNIIATTAGTQLIVCIFSLPLTAGFVHICQTTVNHFLHILHFLTRQLTIYQFPKFDCTTFDVQNVRRFETQ